MAAHKKTGINPASSNEKYVLLSSDNFYTSQHQDDQDDHQGYRVKEEEPFMLGHGVGHALRCGPGDRDQYDGHQHPRNVLGREVAVVVCHGLGAKIYAGADKVEEQTHQQLNVCEDEQKQAEHVVGFGKGTLVDQTDQRFYDHDNQQQQHQVADAGMCL